MLRPAGMTRRKLIVRTLRGAVASSVAPVAVSAIETQIEGELSAMSWVSGFAYFFKGGQYLRFDLETGKVDDGYCESASNFDPTPIWF